MSSAPSSGGIASAANREHPWPGLAPFEEGDWEFFKGRDTAISAIVRLVLREDLSFLWAFSGLGKTSLVRAGLFPRLRELDMFPVYIRLRYDESDPPLAQQCIEAITDAGARWHYETPPTTEGGTLSEYVRRRDHRFWSAKNRLVTPLLVVDQFEEIFAAGRLATSAGIVSFLGDLSSAITGSTADSHGPGDDYLFRPGAFKVLLSFREDFVAQVAKCAPLVNNIGHNYYRLEALSFDDAVAVVREGGGHLIAHVDDLSHDSLCRQIVDHVAGTRTSAARSSVTVDPALLSLYCSQLNDRRRKQQKDKIDASLFEGGGASTIIPDFYEQSMSEISEQARAVLERDLVLHASRTRDSIAEESILGDGVQKAELDKLIARRILRRDTTRQPRIEFTHDVLVDPAVNSFTRRDVARQRAEEEQRRLAEERQRADALQHEVNAERELARRGRRRRKQIATASAAAVAVAIVAGFFELSQEQTIRLLLQASQSQLASDPRLSTVFASWAAGAADRHNPEIKALAAAALNRSVRAAALTETHFATTGSTVVLSANGRFGAVVREDRAAVAIVKLDEPTHVPQVISAADGKQLSAVKFVGDDAELLMLNSDASVERVKLSASPPQRSVFTPRASGTLPARTKASPTDVMRQPKQWALTKAGDLVVSSSTLEYPKVAYPIEGSLVPAPPAMAMTVRYSLAFANVSSGQWTHDVSLPATVSDVILPAQSTRYAMVENNRVVTIKEFDGRIVDQQAFAPSNFVVSPDGSYVIAVPRPGEPRPGKETKAVNTSDLENSRSHYLTVWRVGETGTPAQVSLPGRADIVSTVFSPDSSAFAVVQTAGVTQLWKVPSLQPIFPAPLSAQAVRFAPDGRSMVTWDNATEAQLWRLDGDGRAIGMRGGGDGIIDMAFADDSTRIATLTTTGLRLSTTETPASSLDKSVELKQAGLRAIAFAPNNQELTIGGEGKTFTLALADQIPKSATVEGRVTALTYTADMRRLAMAVETSDVSRHDAPASYIAIRPVRSDAVIRRIDAGRGRITALAFSPTRVAYLVETSYFGGRVEIADLETGQVLRRDCVSSRITGLSTDSRAQRLAFGVFSSAYDNAASLSIFTFKTADMKGSNATAAVANCDTPPTAFPSVAPTSPLRSRSPFSVEALSPAITSPPPLASMPADVEPGANDSLAPISVISGDLRRAISRSTAKEINVWLTLDRSEPPIAFGEPVTAIAMATDGRSFAAGGQNGLLRVFDTQRTTDPLTLQPSGSRIEALTFSPNGARLAAIDAAGRLTLYTLGVPELLQKAHQITQDRVPTVTECAFLGGTCGSDPTTLVSLLRRTLPF